MGEATTKGEFGTPTVNTTYNFLIQSAAGPFSAALLAPGALWKDVKMNGFRYTDKFGSNGGIVRAMLKPGAGGKAQVMITGKGIGLGMPDLGELMLPVTVRLENAQSGLCWEARYDAATTATGKLWKGQTQ